MMNNDPLCVLVADVINTMNSPDRHYHSYDNHIEPMLGDFSMRLSDSTVKLSHPKSIWLAIMFHDYVYSTNPQEYKSNEDNSRDAMYLKTWNIDEFTNEDRHVAAMMITATKTHSVDGIDADSSVIDDIKYFLDLDLMIFSKPIGWVLEFEDGIRQEFEHVPDSIYYPERMRILQTFLDRGNIYQHASNESRNRIAVNSIQRLIDTLHKYYMEHVFK